MSYPNPNSNQPPHYGYSSYSSAPDSIPRVLIPTHNHQHRPPQQQPPQPQPQPSQWHPAHYQQPYPQFSYQHYSSQPAPAQYAQYQPQQHPPQYQLHHYQPVPPAPSPTAYHNGHPLGLDGHVSSTPGSPSPTLPTKPKLSNGQSQRPATPAKLNKPQSGLRQNGSEAQPALGEQDRLVLLTLSDEYLQAARSLSVSLACRAESTDYYYRLIASSLACLEAVCTVSLSSLQPRQVALPRIRLAALMHEETTENSRIESILDRTMRLCETNHLLDLTQTARYFQIRSYLRHSRELAIKSLDDYIRQCTSLQYFPWVYAFRFLRVSAALQHPDLTDLGNAFKQVREMSRLATSRNDYAISYASSIFEALVWLRSARAESNENINRSLATARALQSRVNTQSLPQLQVLLHLTDIATTLSPYDARRAQERVQGLQEVMRDRTAAENWGQDGCFSIPFQTQPGDEKFLGDTAGIFGPLGNGMCSLRFTWLSLSGFRAVCYLVSASASASKAATASENSEKLLKKALDFTSNEASTKDLLSQQALPVVQASLKLTHELRAVVYAQLVHVACAHSAWRSAAEHLSELDKLLKNMQSSRNLLYRTLETASIYLHGAVAQGEGRLDDAVKFYQQPALNLQQPSFAQPEAQRMYTLLAAFNTLFIIRTPEHQQHSRVAAYVTALRHHFPNPSQQQSLTQASSNQHLSAAFSFLLAILPTSMPSLNAQTADHTSILHTKEHLQKSMTAARSVQNTLIVTLCLNWMNHSLFRGIVGQQALQGAQIAKSTADQSGLDVWKDVSGQVLEETVARDQGMMFDSSFDMGMGGIQGWGF